MQRQWPGWELGDTKAYSEAASFATGDGTMMSKSELQDIYRNYLTGWAGVSVNQNCK